MASTFWIGIGGALIAAVSVLFLKEIPMRSTFEMEPKAIEPETADRQADNCGEGAPA